MLVSPTTKKETTLGFKLRSACHESHRTSTELHKEAQQPEQLELQPPNNFKVRHYTVCIDNNRHTSSRSVSCHSQLSPTEVFERKGERRKKSPMATLHIISWQNHWPQSLQAQTLPGAVNDTAWTTRTVLQISLLKAKPLNTANSWTPCSRG